MTTSLETPALPKLSAFDLTALEDCLLSVFIDQPNLIESYPSICQDFFTIPETKAIWKFIKDATDSGRVIDRIYVDSYFKKEQDNFPGSDPYSHFLLLPRNLTIDVSTYVQDLRKVVFRKKLSTDIYKIQERLMSSKDNVYDIAEVLQQQVQEVLDAGGLDRDDPVQCTKPGIDMLQRTRSLADGTLPPAVPTGFSELDYISGGLQGGQLITIGARPSMGKSTFALNIADNIARAGHATLFISLETTPERMMEKLISRATKIQQRRLSSGQGLSYDHWMRLYDSLTKTENVPLYFDDHAVHTAADVEAKIRRTSQMFNQRVKVVIIDYLQLMITGESDNNNAAISKITRGLKLLAMKLKITIIVLSQLSRGVESRMDKRPMVSDLRDSGSIEQDSDAVWMIYRNDYYPAPNPALADKMEILIRKNRDGSIGTAFLKFDPEISSLETVHSLS
jgi:replicative DNA helicase